MTSENNRINDILGLHFGGEKLSDEQEKSLIDWVSRNKEEYQRLSDLFRTLNRTEQPTFDPDMAWAEVNKKLSTPRTVGRYGFRRVISYAACIAMICATALYFVNTDNNKDSRYLNTSAALMTVILPDSSTVTLYPQAKVVYTADAQRNERKTALEGKAFFKVKPDAKRPFTVESNETTVRVLGTSFLVDGEKQSETGVFVREGTVEVARDRHEVVLHANEQALSDENGMIKSGIEHPEIIFNNHIKEVTYKGTPLSKVIKDIENEFKTTITCTDPLKDAKISTKLKFTTVDELLSEICYICNCSYKKITDQQFEVYKP